MGLRMKFKDETQNMMSSIQLQEPKEIKSLFGFVLYISRVIKTSQNCDTTFGGLRGFCSYFLFWII